MYTNAIKTVVMIESPTGRVSEPVSSPVRDRPQHNPLLASNKDNLNQAKATGRCNSHTKTGARELRTITGHSSNEAAAPVDPVVAAAGVVVAAAEEGNINR
jgi:hypothetical protein